MIFATTPTFSLQSPRLSVTALNGHRCAVGSHGGVLRGLQQRSGEGQALGAGAAAAAGAAGGGRSGGIGGEF